VVAEPVDHGGGGMSSQKISPKAEKDLFLVTIIEARS
jgi:hypothetical protein